MTLFGNSIENIKKQIEDEAGKADHLKEERVRVQHEKSYVDEELDRLLRVEDLVEKRHKNQNLQQDREARKQYALMTFILTCVWCVFIFLVIICAAEGYLVHTYFNLSDKVLITLITSTTVNFFGFFILVMKYLFHTDGKTKSKDDKSL